MGRTCGKLINFLRNGLNRNLYSSLKYESQDVFSLHLPRYDRSKPHAYTEYSRLLVDYFECQGRAKNYESYSKAKAVFQVALRKSLYLIELPPSQGKLRFKFATSEESKEKKKLLKEKEKLSHDDPLYVQSGPPSTSSSGYESGEEEKISEGMECNDSLDCLPDLEELEKSCFRDGDTYTSIDFSDLEKILEEDAYDGLLQNQVGILYDEEHTDNNSAQNQADLLVQDLQLPIEVKFYWQFIEKKCTDSILLVICKKQFIGNDGNIQPGCIIIPNEVWEGRPHIWKNTVEVDENLFLFCQKT